jgi:hypothetical protein
VAVLVIAFDIVRKTIGFDLMSAAGRINAEHRRGARAMRGMSRDEHVKARGVRLRQALK